MNAPKRPILRYHGGKWRLAPWIVSCFPDHRCYVEPFGGGASVLLRKDRSYAEVYNDLDGEIVNLFRVLRDPGHAAELVRSVELTPFARTEFDDCHETCPDNPVEQARRTLIKSHMGFAANPARDWKTGFRADSKRSHTTPARDWTGMPEVIASVVERLRGVVIEQRPAMQVMAAHDAPSTLHYVDPPYVHSTRYDDGRHAYRHEMTNAEHGELLAFVRRLEGAVVISGYDHELYNAHLVRWRRMEKAALADGAKKRTEVLWLNERAASANRRLF